MEEEIDEFVEKYDINRKKWTMTLPEEGETVELYTGTDNYHRLCTSFSTLGRKDVLQKIEATFNLLAVDNSRHGEGFYLFESDKSSAEIHDIVMDILYQCFNSKPVSEERDTL